MALTQLEGQRGFLSNGPFPGLQSKNRGTEEPSAQSGRSPVRGAVALRLRERSADHEFGAVGFLVCGVLMKGQSARLRASPRRAVGARSEALCWGARPQALCWGARPQALCRHVFLCAAGFSPVCMSSGCLPGVWISFYGSALSASVMFPCLFINSSSRRISFLLL